MELSLTSDRTSYSLGEPVNLTVALINGLDSTVTVVPPFDSPTIVHFRVTDSTGRVFASSGPWRKFKPFPASRFASLAPGDSALATFDITQQYMLVAGEFGIVANYRNFDDGSTVGVSAYTTDELLSDSITIRISP